MGDLLMKEKTEEELYDKASAMIETPYYEEGVETMKSLAEGEYAPAMFQLGKMYEEGNRVEKDAPKAEEWYRKAAGQGNADAQNRLGEMYEGREGVASEAVEWYRNAAEQGHTDAQFRLGVCYQMGYGTDTDNTKAVEWYLKAAEQGHGNAESALAYMYKFGDGVAKDRCKAEEWEQKSRKHKPNSIYSLHW
ncbi:MAG: sel1 repeat family protein, partial [Butyrivibrio sp.]|nr:sel1 repeat family protein [Butyrivibrio sp.]